MVWRQVGAVRHTVFLRGHIHVALFRAAFGCGDYCHMNAALYLREQNVLVIGPGEPRRIGQHQAAWATEDWHHPGIPRRVGSVSDSRAIGGEHWLRFQFVLVRKLNGLAVWKQLDVDVTRG